MSIKNEVRTTNPIAFSIIRNAKRKQQLSHAYLIAANPKVDTSLVSGFLLQVIVCEIEGVLACGECSTCKKAIANKYIDLQLIDGSTGLIKKEQVIQAVEALQQTSLEKNGKKILFIKNIDAANKQSINSLLKFIEEPQNNTHIIMTTNKLNYVLDTIKSRTQIIQLKPKSIQDILSQILIKGIPRKYAYSLSNIYTDANEALKSYENGFVDCYKQVQEFMHELLLDKKHAPITFKKMFNKKEDFQVLLEIITIYLNDIWRSRIGKEIFCKGSEETLLKYADSKFYFSSVIESIWAFKKAIKFNGNFELAKEKLILEILEA